MQGCADITAVLRPQARWTAAGAFAMTAGQKPMNGNIYTTVCGHYTKITKFSKNLVILALKPSLLPEALHFGAPIFLQKSTPVGRVVHIKTSVCTICIGYGPTCSVEGVLARVCDSNLGGRSVWADLCGEGAWRGPNEEAACTAQATVTHCLLSSISSTLSANE